MPDDVKIRIAISEASGEHGSHIQPYFMNVEMPFNEFIQKYFILPEISDETVAMWHGEENYLDTGKPITDMIKTNVKDVGGFIGGHLQNGRREKHALLFRSLWTCDIEKHCTPADLEDIVRKLGNIRCCITSTHSHRPEAPRARIIMPLSRDVTPAEYELLSPYLMSRLYKGDLENIFDTKSTKSPVQIMFFPSCSIDGKYYFKDIRGELLDVDKYLQRAREAASKKQESAQPITRVSTSNKPEIHDSGWTDPREKTGDIGTFCRCYNVYDVLEKFLPHVYAPTSDKNRFKHIGSEGLPGFCVVDDGQYAFSHHEKDPVSREKRVNAFDLFCIHCHGGNVTEALQAARRDPVFMKQEEKDRAAAVADDFHDESAADAESPEIDEKTKEEQKAEYLASTADRLIPEFFDDVQAKAATPAIPTGFSQLDKALDGGLYEGLYIIGGISSIGKTTFCLQMADQIAEAGHDVLIFSLEMSKYELISRSLSRHTFQALRRAQLAAGEGTEYDKNRFRDAKTSRGITSFQRWAGYSTEERQLIAEAADRYGNFGGNIWIKEGLGNTGAKDIRADIEKHVACTGRSPVVLLDYLQILEPYSERMTDKQNTDKSVKLLKIMSRDFKMPVLTISSFNRANYKTAVDMEAFKESGAIEYSSDVLIGLQLFGAGEKWFRASEEKRKTPRRVQACILKNRNGPTGNIINLKYFAMFNCFEETYERFIPPAKDAEKATGQSGKAAGGDDDEPFTVGNLFDKREPE